jgi:hypothetical protein
MPAGIESQPTKGTGRELRRPNPGDPNVGNQQTVRIAEAASAPPSPSASR